MKWFEVMKAALAAGARRIVRVLGLDRGVDCFGCGRSCTMERAYARGWVEELDGLGGKRWMCSMCRAIRRQLKKAPAAILLLAMGCSGELEAPIELGGLFPGVELCDFSELPLMSLRFEEKNCGPLVGRDESKPGNGGGFCSVSVELDGILPELTAHVTCDTEVPECIGTADTPGGCTWGVSWTLPEAP